MGQGGPLRAVAMTQVRCHGGLKKWTHVFHPTVGNPEPHATKNWLTRTENKDQHLHHLTSDMKGTISVALNVLSDIILLQNSLHGELMPS